jgi:hypothetical protein
MAEKTPKKNAAAVSLGRRGGKKRAELLSKEELSAQGKKAATARWGKKPKAKAKPKSSPMEGD